MEEKTYINICKAFSDNNRMKIFEMLRKQDMCAYEILKNLNCSQPTLSYHMKLLTDIWRYGWETTLLKRKVVSH